MKTCVLLLVVAAAVFASMCRPSQAATTQTPPPTIADTCQAAHDVDRRVSVTFCSTHLRNHRSSIDADARGLAETAAAVGVGNADAARYEVETLLRRRERDEGHEEEEDPVYRRALERCGRLYGTVRARYAAARESIAEGRRGDVERELSDVPAIAHSCDDGFREARSDGAPPLLLYGVDNTQITLLTLTITGLIK